MIPKTYFNPDDPGVLRLLSEAEWRGVGITQSLGWEHYEVHGTQLLATPHATSLIPLPRPCIAPEPHVLLFRRPKNFDSHQAAQPYEGQAPNKAAGAAKNGRKK